MTDKPRRKRWPLAAVCIVAIIAVYVGGYFLFSVYAPYGFWGYSTHPRRVFDYAWVVPIYKPFGYIESTARGHSIEVRARSAPRVGYESPPPAWQQNLKKW